MDLAVAGVKRVRHSRQCAVDAIDLSAPLPRLMDGLTRVLSSHANPDDPLRNACVHTPDYGTRSSTLIALGPESRHYWHSDGPPCEAKYRDLGTLLEGVQPRGSLSPTPSRRSGDD